MVSQDKKNEDEKRFRTSRLKVKTKKFLPIGNQYEENYKRLRKLRTSITPMANEKEQHDHNTDQIKTIDLNYESEQNAAPVVASAPNYNEQLQEISSKSLSKAGLEYRCMEFLYSGKPIPEDGVQLSDVYTLKQLIGEGGNGRIYLARDNNLDIPCAIKILNSMNDREECSQKFYDEIKTTAKLRHPNIVSIFYANHIGDYFYYVMEYIKGKTCEDMIHDKTEEKEIVKVALELAHALKYAHENDVIHRDIKPPNIMVDEYGMVKLLDLGLAISLRMNDNEQEKKKQIAGTPYYLSPEQARGDIDHIDIRADVYGYGATLYHLLTGRPVFKGNNVYETLSLVLNPNLQAKSPKEIVPQISQKMNDIVIKCLAKNSKDRFQNMEEILTALEAME